MKKTATVLSTFVLCGALVTGPSSAQTEPPSDALTEIATALSRIAEAMERQLEGGRLDLLMRQVESRQRRLNLIENQLRSAQREYQGHQHQLTRSEMELERFENEEVAEAMGYDSRTLAVHRESMEFDLQLTRQRISELESRIADLEQKRTRGQREVEDWQAYIDRELAGAP